MTKNDEPTRAAVNELMWPLTVLGVVLLLVLGGIILSGHSADDLVRAITALSATVTTILSAGAYFRSTQAAKRSQLAVKQTDGDLDARMVDAVHEGITRALAVAQQQATGDLAPGPAAVPPKRSRRHNADPPTQKMSPPTA